MWNLTQINTSTGHNNLFKKTISWEKSYNVEPPKVRLCSHSVRNDKMQVWTSPDIQTENKRAAIDINLDQSFKMQDGGQKWNKWVGEQINLPRFRLSLTH